MPGTTAFTIFKELTNPISMSHMILDRLEGGNTTGDELFRELGVDVGVYLDELVEKKFVIKNGDGTYSLNSDVLPS